MKKLYLLLCLVTSVSYAQKQTDSVEVSLPCFETQALFKSLTEKYQESPIAMGKTEDDAGSTMSLWINPLEKSWTIVATKKEISCVVGTGKDFKILARKNGKAV